MALRALNSTAPYRDRFIRTGSGASPIIIPPLYVEDVFSTWIYTGNGSTQTITNGVDLAGEGGLVWIKVRDYSGIDHVLFDTTRGAYNSLYSTGTDGQSNWSPYSLTSFNSNGFSVSDNANGAYRVNGSGSLFGELYASWTFRKAPKFFDVVTYTGDGNENKTISHNLGSVPACVIIKRTDSAGNWMVAHGFDGSNSWSSTSANFANNALTLNLTDASSTDSEKLGCRDATSTTFRVYQATTPAVNYGPNYNGATYVAYLFAHDAGGFGDSENESVIKCGSFTTDSSGNATVDLGWEPQWLMTKMVTDSPGNMVNANWIICDTMRGFTSSNYPYILQAESSYQEYERGIYINPNSSGFRYNQGYASQTYIYIAIRRGPMKTPTSGTEVFNAITRTGTGSALTTTNIGFPLDLYILADRAHTTLPNTRVYDRLRGVNEILETNTTSAAQADAAPIQTFTNNGVAYYAGNSNPNISETNYIDWFFRRAPGFFDVVAYTGTGVARTVPHNLGVVPELMIVKNRNDGEQNFHWVVYHSSLGATKVIYLNLTSAADTSSGPWNDTSPTSSVFTVGNWGNTNGNNNPIIAYLFATLPGVSKVGSYTGTGTTLNIDCGFTSGARFVLIKRTDTQIFGQTYDTDWYVWDTARGIVSGNDPYLTLNETAQEVTNTDYIDPLSSGFQISSTAPAAINANGGTYIFLAIA